MTHRNLVLHLDRRSGFAENRLSRYNVLVGQNTALENLAERLGRVSHFSRLPKDNRLEIVKTGCIQLFRSGSTIFREGEPSSGMFVLLSGHVHLYKLGPRGKQSMVAEIQPVIMFNEVSVVDGGPNLTTAVAISDCETWRLEHIGYEFLIQHYPEVGLGLMHVLAMRTRLLMSHYEDLSFRSVLARTAKLLLDLSSYGEKAIDRREYTNHEMAARISTVPEALSRSLQVFKKSGDIICTRAAISVRYPELLAQLAQIDPALFKG